MLYGLDEVSVNVVPLWSRSSEFENLLYGTSGGRELSLSHEDPTES